MLKARIAGLLLLLNSFPALGTSNPLLISSLQPDFKAITAADFAPAIDKVLAEYNAALIQITKNPPSWDNTIQPLEEQASNVSRVWSLISHLENVNDSTEIREAYSSLLPKMTEFSSSIMHNPELFTAYKTIANSTEFAKLNEAQQNLIKQMLLDFKLSGAELSAKEQKKYNTIKLQLNKLSNQFSHNVLDATKNWQLHIHIDKQNMLAGLPDYTITAAAELAKSEGKEGWILTLDAPCIMAISTYAQDRSLRETIFRAYSTLASDQAADHMHRKYDNSLIITEILKLRQELAQLLGYKNYAEFSLADKEAPSTDKVISFLQELATHSKPAATQEFAALQEFAQLRDKIDKLEPWDINYYAELYRNEHYGVSQQELRDYFPEKAVLAGLFKLVNKLYEINISEIKNASTWDPNVKLFQIIDKDQQPRGYFYIDLYARPNKRSGAWMADYTSRLRYSNGDVQLPVAFICANFTPSTDGLLMHNDVITLFHEFGHMLQHTLTLTDYPSISGINGVAQDAVELASQFMENWAWQYPVVTDISQNIHTGDDLPQELFDKLYASKNYNAALAMLRQVEFALFDFKLHLASKDSMNKTPLVLLSDIRKEISVVPVLETDRFPHKFQHIFAGGYAAGYYGYKWAEVLACDAFSAFTEHGLFDQTLGQKFLHTFLERGGEKSTLDLFIAFRDREPSIDPLLEQSGIIQVKS